MIFKLKRHNGDRYMEEVLHLEPRIEELTLGSVSLYDIAEYFAARPHFVFLDSHLHGNRLSRYSFIAIDPFLVFKSKGNKVWFQQKEDGQEKVEEESVENIFDCPMELEKVWHLF